MDAKRGPGDSEFQEWRFSIEIPSDLLMESNIFELGFDKNISTLTVIF